MSFFYKILSLSLSLSLSDLPGVCVVVYLLGYRSELDLVW